MRISDWSSDVCSSDLQLISYLHHQLCSLQPEIIDDMLATIEHGFGLVGHHLPRISDYFRKNSPPKNDHHQPKGSQQGHDLQFFISCDQLVGFYSEEYQHKNGR